MTEPMSAIITAIVSVFTAYTNYKASVDQAEEQNAPMPAKTEAAEQGEQAIVPVKEALQHHGGAREQKLLAHFEDDPELYSALLTQVMTELAERDAAFATALRNAARQSGIVNQDGIVSNKIDIRGNVYGQVINEVRDSSITNTYSKND